MKKIISLFLIATMLCSFIALTGCTSYTDPTDSIKVQVSEDKYRNYYEIFVGSFCDSDGDNIGDLQGIISKLDYLNDGNPETDTDLGIDGIWLTPIMPSESYHKYDVIDYFDIDEDFGTLDDFKQLVDECHKRGINVIIDMVLNHCSKFMPLFENACSEAMKGNLEGDAKYFEIDYFAATPSSAYTEIGNGYYYESNFSPYMPEWDLDAKCTRDYFLDIAEFWLKDYDVDGFRLDAVKYFDDTNTNGQKFLKWYYDEVQKIDPDVYMVGELWTGNSQITDMYESGIDSLFAFGYAGPTGAFINTVRSEQNTGYLNQLKDYNSDRINGFFLSNHDQIRSGNNLKMYGASFTKMAAAAYMLVPGNSYIYYGEEIGMVQDSQAQGDEYKREPMIWDTENPPIITVNNLTGYDESQGIYGGVQQQLEDENSILSYYRRLIKIKNQNPEIARGKITETYEIDKNTVGYNVGTDESKVLIIHNFSATETKTVDLEAIGMSNCEIRGDLVASNGKQEDGSYKNENITRKDAIITMPPQSTVILK